MLIQNGGVRNADLGTFEVRVGELPAFAAIGKGSEISSGGRLKGELKCGRMSTLQSIAFKYIALFIIEFKKSAKDYTVRADDRCF